MTTYTDVMPRSRAGAVLHLVSALFVGAFAITGTALRQKSVPAFRHFGQHAYSVLGLSCFCGAAFYHSIFAGLLVTGAAWFLFEWKTSDEKKAGEQ